MRIDPAVTERLAREMRDARSWQIAALASLLGLNIATLSLGASLMPSLVAVVSALLAQGIAGSLSRVRFEPRSALITGLSLALLIRGDGLWVPALAAFLAIASKFTLRIEGKHLWNPAAFGIYLVLMTGHAWVSPGQWGSSALVALLVMGSGLMVLTRAARLDTALAFLGTHLALLFGRAIWLGDPLAIPLHQAGNGALLLFALFMITDPRTTPDARVARLVFAAAVACLGHWLIFFDQMRPGLYVALIVLAPLVPLLDRVFPASGFVWRPVFRSFPAPLPR
jgi:Na+-transporting NADH:ubiquinone oxidoreductase subunit NqrB